MPRLEALDAFLYVLGKRIVCLAHVHELRVAAAFRQPHGIKRSRFWGLDIVRVIGVVSLAGDVDAPILQFLLIGDVVDLRTFGDREAGILLQKDLAEDLHRLKKLWSVQPLVADRNHRVVEKSLIEPCVGFFVNRTADIEAGNLGAGMNGQWRHRKGTPVHDRFLHDRSIHRLRRNAKLLKDCFPCTDSTGDVS